MSSNRRGFTLVELLVVVAIIAILAAIIFPVFSSARQKSMQMSCLSNMRQIGMAINMYASDNSDGLPTTWHWDNRGWCGQDASWKQIVYPYQKSDDLYHCPMYPDKGVDCTQYVTNPQVHYLGQYGINNWAYIPYFTGANPNDSDYETHENARLSGLTNPSETLLVSENGDSDWIVEPLPYKCVDPDSQIRVFTADYGLIKFPHVGKTSANATFADGHAKSLTQDQFHANDCYIWWRTKPQE